MSEKFVSRDKFLEDLKSLQVHNNIINEQDFYIGYLKFLKLLLTKKHINLSVSDNFEKDMESLSLNDSEIQISSWEELLRVLRYESDNVEITLKTSGTTGKPKEITHSFNNLKRNVKLKGSNLNKVWLLCYHPYHMAGLQVFLQALLTDSCIIFLNKPVLGKIEEVIKQYNVTSLAFTPTLFKQFRHLFSSSYPSIESISFGGEKASDEILENAKHIFPAAKVRTIYASTEGGSLFSSEGNIFKVEKDLWNSLKIDSNNELLLHEKLVGKSDFLEDGWYRTGDIVEVLDEGKLRIVARVSDFVSIGGYKVNPIKVETVVSESDYVEDVLIKSKENSILGHALIAEVVLKAGQDRSEAKQDILSRCRIKLNDWEIPSMIKFVDSISMGETGKRIRK